MPPRARATAILGDLVAFPTVSPESNLDCIAYARDLLEPIATRIEVTPDETGTKANLFATIGPDIDGGVILSGHLDVVPAEGQIWTVDPFAMSQADGRLYGRGTCDMKGFVACALALAPEFASAGLARPVHIALTHDEEVGCLGAPRLIEGMVRSGRRPAACIVGEPTEMRIIEGHKGCCEYATVFEGLEGHGSRPELGVNAVVFAMRFVRELETLAEALRARAPAGWPFEPPWTTISVGRIEGGIARNVIPNLCTVDWEFRPVNREDADFVRSRMAALVEDELLPAMRGVHPGARIETQVIGEVAGLIPQVGSEALYLATRLTGQNTTGLVSFGTEAGLFQAAGVPTVLCGPGSIAQAHRPDEFVALSEIDRCLEVLGRLKAELSP